MTTQQSADSLTNKQLVDTVMEKQKGHIQTAYQSTEEATESPCAARRLPI